MKRFLSVVSGLVLGIGLSGCGAGQIEKEKLAAYFSGFAEGHNLQAVSLQGYIPLFCNDANDAKISGKQGEQVLTLKNCEKNGVKTNGELKQKISENEMKVDGKLDFEVIDPAQNAVADCRDLIKKGDKASCSVDAKITKDGGDTKLCGMKDDDFNSALQNSCSKGDKK